MEPECVVMLKEMGDWMRVNGEGIYGSVAWNKWGEGSVVLPNGKLGQTQVDTPYTEEDIRFTRKGDDLYAWLMAWPEDGTVNVTSLAEAAGEVTGVELLGSDAKFEWKQTPAGLEVKLPAEKPCKFAWGLRVSGKGLVKAGS